MVRPICSLGHEAQGDTCDLKITLTPKPVASLNDFATRLLSIWVYFSFTVLHSGLGSRLPEVCRQRLGVSTFFSISTVPLLTYPFQWELTPLRNWSPCSEWLCLSEIPQTWAARREGSKRVGRSPCSE